MPFDHGCFISHVSAQEALMKEFVEGLAEALRSELEPFVDNDPIYLDEERLKPGYRFNPALARGICASACWIMVFVPQYSKHPYCLREFRAMQILEERRRKALGSLIKPEQGMIIPIILRGNRDQLPANLGSTVQCLEFNRFTTATGKILRNQTYIEQIAELAEYVGEIYEIGRQLKHDCDDFAIPELDGDPGFAPGTQSFPGRTNPAIDEAGEE